MTSAYGTAIPEYKNADLQRAAIVGRIEVARHIIATTDREVTRARWKVIIDELLDRLLELRG